MIEFSLRGKTKLAVDFTFFAALALFFYFDESGFGLMSISACVIHEAGHLLALFIMKKDFISLTFYGGGIKIGYEKNVDVPAFLIVAGSFFNFVFFIAFYFIFALEFNFKTFAVINLIIGVFNLLPLRYFDGGNLLEKALISAFTTDKALMILRKTEKITLILFTIFAVLIFCFFGINLSVLIVMIYVIVSDIIVKIE